LVTLMRSTQNPSYLSSNAILSLVS
jgi:hypothetical protein